MKLKAILLASAAFALAACDSDDVAPLSTNGPLFNPSQQLIVQVIHAVPDAPEVNVTLGSSTISGLDFKGAIGGIGIEPGTVGVTVSAVDADGTIDVIGPANIPFAADTITTIVAVGSTATIQPLIVEQPLTGPADGNARVFVLHGFEGAGIVDVYVSAAGVAPVAGDLLGSFDFLGELGPAEVPAGDYLITVTEGGNAANVLYDATVTLSAGLDAVLVATPTTTGGTTAPLSLVGFARNINTAVEFRDDDDPGFVRVTHASPDAPAVDVVADGAVLIPGLTFPNDSGIAELPAATYEIEVSPAGAYPGTVVIPNDGSTIPLAVGAGTTTEVLAIGPLATIDAITATDDPRSIAIYAKVRAIHASPTAPNVDIHVSAPGAALSADTVALADVPFGANSGFVPLDNVADPGAPDYDITITATGSLTPAIGPIALELADGDVITVIARDEVGGGAISADVIVLTN